MKKKKEIEVHKTFILNLVWDRRETEWRVRALAHSVASDAGPAKATLVI